MPRFVILEHDYPKRHWDFLLEVGEVLRSWRLAEPPHPGREVAAEASFDHRLLYLDYEGPIGGGRGRVVRWDGGTFTWQMDEAGAVAVLLNGIQVQGLATLRRNAEGGWVLLLKGVGQEES